MREAVAAQKWLSPDGEAASLGAFRVAPRSRASGTHRSSRLEISSNLRPQNCVSYFLTIPKFNVKKLSQDPGKQPAEKRPHGIDPKDREGAPKNGLHVALGLKGKHSRQGQAGQNSGASGRQNLRISEPAGKHSGEDSGRDTDESQKN